MALCSIRAGGGEGGTDQLGNGSVVDVEEAYPVLLCYRGGAVRITNHHLLRLG